jgi:ubiquinone/menaquinone biosynthesis C-methylase UbiE
MQKGFFSKCMDQLMHGPNLWTKWLHNPPGIRALRNLPKGAKVLDVGCYGFRQVEISKLNGRLDLLHHGLDHPQARIEHVPEGFVFRSCDIETEPFPFSDAMFDLVVASHVLEHVRDPIRFLRECARVSKPGGLISIETPSERSVMLPGFPFQHDKFMSLSFYDDPTHNGRPWTSQGLYRLAKSMGMTDISVSYDWNLMVAIGSPILLPLFWLLGEARAFQYVVWKSVGWNVRLLTRRPTQNDASEEFRYFIPHRS